MKSIVYILILAILGSILVSTITLSNNKTDKEVTIQCADKNADTSTINTSAKIIENRLKSFGIEGYKVVPSKTDATINISFYNDGDSNKVSELLTSKGKVEFYETIDRKDVIENLSKENKLFTLLNTKNTLETAILGTCSDANKTKVDKHILSMKDNETKYAWSKFPTSDNVWSLYLLKSNSVLNGSSVINSESKHLKDLNSYEVSIDFNKEGAKIFEEVTRRNIEKPIAIVIDNEVYFAPIVWDEIKGGKCSVTGNLSDDEAYRISAIIKNGELPAEFKIVK